MKTHRLLSILVMGLAIMIIGCQGEQNPIEAPLSDQGAGSSLAKATTTMINQTIDFDLTLNVPCAAGGAGEDVFLSGPLHLVFVMTVNGNHYTLMAIGHPQGITGTGLTTGDRYQGTGATRFTSTGSFVNGQSTETLVDNFYIIGVGNDNNFYVHETFHVTVNANGDVTANVDNPWTECR